MSDALKPELLRILQHSLGLDQYGQGRQYRNHYVAGGKDIDLCRELVDIGYMVERTQNGLTGGSPWFSVTPQGIDAVALQSPKPPKLTRAQKRYRRWLDIGDCFDTFRDFLIYETAREKEARHDR